MNFMTGRIAGIECFGSLALVDVDADADQKNLRLTATVIGMAPFKKQLIHNAKVNLLFAETDLALAKNLTGMISTRNRIPCRVIGIDRGQLLASISLVVFTGSDIIHSTQRLMAIITTRSSYSLELAVGDRVEALIKSNEMRLEIAEA
jgi:molybdate transport system regulatory protein